jgi:hypothetical protein
MQFKQKNISINGVSDGDALAAGLGFGFDSNWERV